MLTVFDNPSSFNVKHPLQNRWTLWFDNPQKRTGMHNWEKSLKNLITFDTVEDFWGVYNNIVNSSQLAHGANYHLFKEGVRPMWEDPMNENGGKWVVPLPKGKRDNLDDYWLHTMLACVGENFPDSDEICGAVVSIRKQQDRLALWTRNALKEDETKAAGTIWKTVLQLPDSETIGYQAHSDALKKNSRYVSCDFGVHS
ncbi:putative eukaryotic initiation factor 4E [Fimicolochytrium jonesii]|uniref:putative eukaryotic initiation factor 4E n=1 Tax=Fimicolochytrium jonesii TaxID=1396493 RepID=UPI0022FEB54E|nr:putative eukaryotic initiation factor 4E [Fimicolochytrium jonesii]KAI8816696.1 putative eukaryotic initiation factor 4E [Fimicolochytrium jonesii]